MLIEEHMWVRNKDQGVTYVDKVNHKNAQQKEHVEQVKKKKKGTQHIIKDWMLQKFKGQEDNRTRKLRVAVSQKIGKEFQKVLKWKRGKRR